MGEERKEQHKGANKDTAQIPKSAHPVVRKVLERISEIEKQIQEKEAEEKEGKKKKTTKKRRARAFRSFVLVLVVSPFIWLLWKKPLLLSELFRRWYSSVKSTLSPGRDSVHIRNRLWVFRKKEVVSAKATEVSGKIPVYPGATGVTQRTEDNIITINFSTGAPLEEVMRFYLGEMGKREFRLLHSEHRSGAGIGQLHFSFDGGECVITMIEGEKSGTDVTISYTEPR